MTCSSTTRRTCRPSRHPRAYVGPAAIEPKLNESIMVTKFGQECPFCEGLHGSWRAWRAWKTARPSTTHPASRSLLVDLDDQANRAGVRGDDGEQAYEELAKTYGEDRAKSIKSLCLFLHWGPLGGNTLNDSLSKLGEGDAFVAVTY